MGAFDNAFQAIRDKQMDEDRKRLKKTITVPAFTEQGIRFGTKEMDIPEFTAYEINELSRRARTSFYYAKCLKFVKDTVLNDLFDISLLEEKQIKWLWGIKRDLSGAGDS